MHRSFEAHLELSHHCLILLAPLISPSPRLRAQEASSTSILSIPKGRLCLWQVQVRPAPRSVWLGPRPATSLTIACAPQGRARLSLNGSRRSWAPRPPSFRELSHRVRRFACTFSLPCSDLWVCCLGRLVFATVNECGGNRVVGTRNVRPD